MKKITISLAIIAIVSAVSIGATVAYFDDTEISSGNTFSAGTLDLQIDLQCDQPGCSFSLRDLLDERAFFNICDIKPGDSNEVTISWHVYDNTAWARIKLANIFDWENGCNEPEDILDDTCLDPGLGQGELDDYLIFTLWMDEGSLAGWQCPENFPHCPTDLLEGDNLLNGIETLLATKTASELIAGVILPGELSGAYTYYLGMQWDVAPEVGNIIQTDSLSGKIIMEVVQSRNNPNPWQP